MRAPFLPAKPAQVPAAEAVRPEGAPTSRGPLAVVGRLGWGVTDQAVSSASNFVLGVLMARELDPTAFGAFGLAFVTFGLVITATRGIATDPFLVRYSGSRTPAWERAVAASSATATAAGVVAGVLCVLVGLALPSEVGAGFVALGCVLPGLTLQDSLRFAFFSVGQPQRALLNDAVWTVLQFGALAGLVLTRHVTEVTCFLVLGGTATLAAGFGLLQCRIRPRPGWVWGWVTEHRALGGRYLVENVSIAGARQIRMVTLGAVAGLASVGDVRAAEMLMGPFLVMLMGVSQLAVPEASHVVNKAPERLERFCLMLGLGTASTACLWGVAMLFLLPLGVGDLVLGPIWKPALSLLPPVMLLMLINAFEISAAAAVRALGAARRSLFAQLVNAGSYLIGGCLGAYLDGARGSCWGVAAAQALATLVWWGQMRRALVDHLGVPAAAGPAEQREGMTP
jgi:O-antigen/teichoic acid export membrane protein